MALSIRQAQCDDSTTKKMEFEFHSAGYLTLLEAVQAMKNVLGHLINFIKVWGNSFVLYSYVKAPDVLYCCCREMMI